MEKSILLHALIAAVDEGRDLVQGIGDHLHQTVRRGIGSCRNRHHPHIAVFDDQETDGRHLDTAADTAAKGLTGTHILDIIGATAAEAHADLGHGDDGHAVRCGDGLADDIIHIHQFADLRDGVLHHVRKIFAHLQHRLFCFS